LEVLDGAFGFTSIWVIVGAGSSSMLFLGAFVGFF
jgi:hypothetical protein